MTEDRPLPEAAAGGYLHRVAEDRQVAGAAGSVKAESVVVSRIGLVTIEPVHEGGASMSLEKVPNPSGVEGSEAGACHHHWLIEPAHGSVSQGVCQVCQEVRDFKNSIEWQYGQRRPGRPASS